MENIGKVIERYRQNAIGVANTDPKRANESYDAVHACYKVLRESEEGRGAIIALMADAEPGVRCAAASHSLQWEPDIARSVLELLRNSNGPFSFTAEMVLKEYDKGRLTFDF